MLNSKEITRLQSVNFFSSLEKMILCSFSCIIPLLIGNYWGLLVPSLLGSLAGMALTLNDLHGRLHSRVKHLFFTFLALNLGYIIGSLVGDYYFVTIVITTLFSFVLGKIKGQNIELERIFLFLNLNIITVAGLKLPIKHVVTGLSFSTLSYIVYIAMVFALKNYNQDLKKNNYIDKISFFRTSFYNQKNLRFAFSISAFTIIGYIISSFLKIQREYWIVGTIIIVMVPDLNVTFQRAAQRILGTLFGIAFFYLILLFPSINVIQLLILIFISTLFIPLMMSINFALGNLFITLYVLCLVKISVLNFVNFKSIIFLRLEDVIIGSIIGFLGMLLFRHKSA